VKELEQTQPLTAGIGGHVIDTCRANIPVALRTTSGPYDPNVLGYVCATMFYTKRFIRKGSFKVNCGLTFEIKL